MYHLSQFIATLIFAAVIIHHAQASIPAPPRPATKLTPLPLAPCDCGQSNYVVQFAGAPRSMCLHQLSRLKCVKSLELQELIDVPPADPERAAKRKAQIEADLNAIDAALLKKAVA